MIGDLRDDPTYFEILNLIDAVRIVAMRPRYDLRNALIAHPSNTDTGHAEIMHPVGKSACPFL